MDRSFDVKVGSIVGPYRCSGSTPVFSTHLSLKTFRKKFFSSAREGGVVWVGRRTTDLFPTLTFSDSLNGVPLELLPLLVCTSYSLSLMSH